MTKYYGEGLQAMDKFKICVLLICLMCLLEACDSISTGTLVDRDDSDSDVAKNFDDMDADDLDIEAYMSSQNDNFSYEELLEALQTAADGDEMVSEPLMADFNGDGQDEMVSAFGHPNGEMFLQYFVYSDGVKTETFGDEENSVHYETKLFSIDVGNEIHIAYSSYWRPAALGGWMASCGIFSIGSSAQNLMYEEFCELDNPEHASIEMICYEEPRPGGKEVMRSRLYWKNGKYTNANVTVGITRSNYAEASIQPKEDPEIAWSGIGVMEVQNVNGVHFYLPDNCNLCVKSVDYNRNPSFIYYDSVVPSDTRFILSVEKQDTWTIENSDFGAVDPWEIGVIGDEHYFLVFPTEMEMDLTPGFEMMEFCDTYREMIVNTAWVE